MKKKGIYRIKIALSLLLILSLILTAGCGSKKENAESKSETQALEEVNAIPEDGIITKEQFKTIAGEDKEIQFTGETEDGIQYVWTYHAAQIQNPDDQNLKIDFTSENLEEIKTQANDANDALKLTMHGKGLICIPTLTITLPEAWQSDTGLLLKEQGGNLARMSDVTVDSKPETEESQAKDNASAENEKADGTERTDSEQMSEESRTGENSTGKSNAGETENKAGTDKSKEEKRPQKGQTILSMEVTSLDGDCYIVGGIAGNQNKGADAANESNSSKAAGNTGGQSAGQETGTSNSQGNTPGNTQQSDQSGSDASDNDANSQAADDEDVENDVETQQTSHTCTISISCATILNNMDNLTSGKEEFVPADGWILAASTVEYEEGESVHDVLKRVCKEAGIHMESSYTPAYNSAYVEGINQLYEFDCGEYSGWMYKVNGWFPNYGCSKYTISDGDVIDWVYTCDLGKDVGDNSMY